MDIGGVAQASVARSVEQSQGGIAIKVMSEQMQEDRELVGQILSGGQQIAAQVYNGHGQVVPTPAGASIDMQM